MTRIFISIGISYYFRINKTAKRLRTLIPYEIDPSSIKRLSLYAFLNQNLASNYLSLSNNQLDADELLLLDLMSLFVGSFDDLMDEHHLSKDEIFNIIKSNEESGIELPNVKICKFSYRSIISRHPNLSLFERYLDQGTEAQERDVKVKQVTKDLDELKSIMMDKGAYSLLLILSALKDFDASDQHAVYSLGSMIQFANDVFDIYKDLQAGEWTYASNIKNMKVLMFEYRAGLENCFNAWRSMGYESNSLEKFWIRTYALLCRGEIAIKHYIERDVLSKPKMLRSDWICDMERFDKIIKNYKLVLNWFKVHQEEGEGD